MSTVDLSWFYALPPEHRLEHQVELLTDPRQLSAELTGQIPKTALSPESWEDEPPTPRLKAEVIERLEQIRRDLDDWWDDALTGGSRPNNEHDLLIDHRTDAEPPERYTRLVNNEARQLGEKTAVVTAYIKMKAQEQR
jgi:hypothetical protein